MAGSGCFRQRVGVSWSSSASSNDLCRFTCRFCFQILLDILALLSGNWPVNAEPVLKLNQVADLALEVHNGVLFIILLLLLLSIF